MKDNFLEMTKMVSRGIQGWLAVAVLDPMPMDITGFLAVEKLAN